MKYKKKLIIIGAGGHGKVIVDIAIKMKKWDCISFLDDDIENKTVSDFLVLGPIQEAYKYKESAEFIIAIGNNKLREKIYNRLKKEGFAITTLIHPSTTIGIHSDIDEGSVIMAGVVINPFCKIGKGVIINTSASIDHDCTVGDFVHISPGVHVAGTSIIRNRTWLGIGSCVVNDISICEDTIVGAGAVVIGDILKPGIYLGIPAKISN